ncbi:MAG: hypothetical protein NT004_17460 [Bacteroidetes bacterium]|nr:hypothetical protein [Bacteroidota bacterium]
MKNIRIVLISLFVLLAIAGFSWLGFNLYQKFHRPAESPFNAIPGNTALIIQLNQTGNLLDELNRSNLLWKSISQFPGIIIVRNELQYFDSASRKNQEISHIFQQYKIWVAITLSGRSNFGALYLASVNGADPDTYILDFIKDLTEDKAIITSTPYSTTNLHRIQVKGVRNPFYFAVMKGVFTGSYHANLVKRSIDRLSLNTPLATSAGFKKVEATVGKKADANIYINYRFFSLVLSTITREETLADLIKFSGFADWSGLDLIIKKDELLFNGITVASDSSQQFLSLFSDQEPQKMEISAIVPSNAIYFTAYGWSDPARFSRRFQSRTINDEKSTADQNAVASLIDHFQLNIGEYFLPWIGSEACVFGLDNPGSAEERDCAAIAASDTVKAASLLLALGDSIGLKSDSVVYQGSKVYLLDLPPFFPSLFGEIFGKVKVKCFTFVNGYLVMGNSTKDIEQIINQFQESATLEKDKTYSDFASNLPDNYNVYSYYNTRNAIHTIQKLLSQSLSAQLNPVLDSLRKIESIAFQFSNADGLFYSNFFLRYNPNLENEGPLQWQARLDTTIGKSPKIINITRNGDKAIILADINNKLYLISPEGEIRWKLPIMGNIQGEIHTIARPGYDSLFLLFNTDTHLYMLHADGRFADKYPMRFPLRATNALTLIPPDKNDVYTILVAFQDNRLYKFNLEGTSFPDWKRPNIGEEISHEAYDLNIGNRHYFVVTGNSGKTIITNPDGNPAIALNPGFIAAPSSGFYCNKTNKKGVILTTGHGGKLVFIQENGRKSEVTLNIFSPDHRFFYEDITGNAQPEFIYSDRNQIFYYNRNYKLIYSYAFRRDIRNDPFILHGPGGKALVGFVVPETNELFLFDHKGYCELESGIRGNTPFDIGILEKGRPMSLIVGAGRIVKNYRLSKF